MVGVTTRRVPESIFKKMQFLLVVYRLQSRAKALEAIDILKVAYVRLIEDYHRVTITMYMR